MIKKQNKNKLIKKINKKKIEKKGVKKEIIKKEKPTEKSESIKKYKYRITSPNNFKSIPQMKHGTSIMCDILPTWAINNPYIVSEKLN